LTGAQQAGAQQAGAQLRGAQQAGAPQAGAQQPPRLKRPNASAFSVLTNDSPNATVHTANKPKTLRLISVLLKSN
jgi:hypothetical protein